MIILSILVALLIIVVIMLIFYIIRLKVWLSIVRDDQINHTKDINSLVEHYNKLINLIKEAVEQAKDKEKI